MPDIIDGEFVIWKDEKCASCLDSDGCAVINVMREFNLVTHSGVHVIRCDKYNPDKSSDWYIDENSESYVQDYANLSDEAAFQKLDQTFKRILGIGGVEDVHRE